MENRYWPFDVGLPEKRSEDVVRFLEAASAEGYKPYELGIGSFSYGARANDHRVAEIIARGRKRWELILGTEQEEILAAFLDDFEAAADAVLRCLRGGDARDILTELNCH